jgi:radical SAM superfamily enzyme YgiQ (UPF0313 family)
MSNVLLIRPIPALDDTQNYATESPPIGIISLGAYLRTKNINVSAIDYCTNPQADAVETISQVKPDVIGISAMTCDFPATLAIADRIKRHYDIPIVVGGAHPTIFQREVLENASIDFAIAGEGEYAFHELITAFRENKTFEKIPSLGYKRNGAVIINDRRPPIKMHTLPFPDYSLIDNEKYIAFGEKYLGFRHLVMIISRGCPGRCTFCAQNQTMGRQFRAFPPERLFPEIKRQMKQYNVEGVWFKDSTLTTSKGWIMQLCDEIIKSRIGMKWSCFSRVDQIDRDIIRNMKKAGLMKLWIGVESGSDRILQLLKKDITADKTREAFRICKEEGVDTAAFYMFGLPTETVEEMEATFELACELNVRPMHIAIYHPLPGTELYDAYNGEEVVRRSTSREMAFDMACMSTGSVHKELVQEIYDSVSNYFLKNGPRPDFKEFAKKASLQEAIA